MTLSQVPTNLNGCPVRIATFADLPAIGPPRDVPIYGLFDIMNANLTEGYEIQMMKTLADKLNFTTNYK